MRYQLNYALLLIFSVFALACQNSNKKSYNNPDPDGNLKEQIIQMENDWVKAALDKDIERFASYMHEDYAGVVSGGRKLDKISWVAKLRESTVEYESVKLNNLVVNIYENVVVVKGEYTQKAMRDGTKEDIAGIYINTWIKQEGPWQVLSSGFSRTKE